MNALGDRCHSVLVLVSTTQVPTPLLDITCGYYVGCVFPSTSTTNSAPSTEDIIQRVDAFCCENSVVHAMETVADDTAHTLLSKYSNAIEHLTQPLTLIDATAMRDASSIAALLTWLYHAGSIVEPTQKGSAESPYSLVAVLDVSRGAVCTLPSSHEAKHDDTVDDVYAWLRPTPSYYSELAEAAKVPRALLLDACATDSTASLQCFVFPVQMYSRYPVVRDRGLQEGLHADGSVDTVPVQQWTNKSTLDAVLRELAFKAGQLAKYGA
jgi:hypothetical protein